MHLHIMDTYYTLVTRYVCYLLIISKVLFVVLTFSLKKYHRLYRAEADVLHSVFIPSDFLGRS
jgi:hypothetical protein